MFVYIVKYIDKNFGSTDYSAWDSPESAEMEIERLSAQTKKNCFIYQTIKVQTHKPKLYAVMEQTDSGTECLVTYPTREEAEEEVAILRDCALSKCNLAVYTVVEYEESL